MKALYKALADFQQEVPTIKKNASGYGYKFADLEEITKVINPLLKKHGLGYTQPLDGTNLKTVLFHIESGDAIESSVEIPQGVQLAKMNEFQVMGSAITYYRRYSLVSILGLVTDEDADAAGEQVKAVRQAPINKSGADQEILARAKAEINSELGFIGYGTPASKTTFIRDVLGKTTVDSEADANKVKEALKKVKVIA